MFVYYNLKPPGHGPYNNRTSVDISNHERLQSIQQMNILVQRSAKGY
jgi:hypothetical protein